MERFLITRLSAIGDCVLTLPMLCALRDRYPDAFIAWVVETSAAPLIDNHVCLDELIVVRKGWLKSPGTLLELRRRLRALRIDVSIDPQSLTKSAVVARLSRARQRLALAAPIGRELALWLNNQLIVTTAPHVVDRQLELLRPLDVRNPRVRFELPQDEVEQSQMERFVRRTLGASPFVVINPGAGWASRRWPAERFAEVARFLDQKFHLRSLVVWAGPEELVWAEQIIQQSSGAAVLAPPTTLQALAALMRWARFYLGADTGPMHIAAAVATPCLALHGPTQPEKSGPYGTIHLPVQAYYQAGTSRQRRSANNDAMLALTVEMVCDACCRLLERLEAGKIDSDASDPEKDQVHRRRSA